MRGYRNTILIAAGIITSTWLGILAIQNGSDLMALATLIGAKDASIGLSIFGRARNKQVEAENGKS